MAGRKELGDIIVEWRAPKYHPIDGYESSDISAKPYFFGIFPTEVFLQRYTHTILEFKIGGRPDRNIWGQVTRPDNHKYEKFPIKPGTRQGSLKAVIHGNVVIKPSYLSHGQHLVGYWYLTIWYDGAPSDYYGEVKDDYKATTRRTVRLN